MTLVSWAELSGLIRIGSSPSICLLRLSVYGLSCACEIGSVVGDGMTFFSFVWVGHRDLAGGIYKKRTGS